jgi:hypothetical protein
MSIAHWYSILDIDIRDQGTGNGLWAVVGREADDVSIPGSQPRETE